MKNIFPSINEHKKDGKEYNTLVIIGNGFDLAHGYNTSYKSFSENMSAECLKKFKDYCEKENKINTWYNFEENINYMTRALYDKSISSLTNDSSEDYYNNLYELNEIFTNIHDLLITYLKNETEKELVDKFLTVQKYIDSNTQVINFNYTSTAEKYSKNIFYVHGSIAEEDILLGYDYRDEVCLAQFNDMKWSKIFCREGLAFRRYLKNKKHIEKESATFKKLIKSFDIYQQHANSSRGIDINSEREIPDYHFIKEFMMNYNENMNIPDIDYGKIETVVVMGHGIEADKVFLDSILIKCIKLKEVIIYRYDGEKDLSYNLKTGFFEKYTHNIKTEFYR